MTKRKILFLLAILLVLAVTWFIVTQGEVKKYSSFREWYADHPKEKVAVAGGKERSNTYVSSLMKIDMIYRSMEGPMCNNVFSLTESLLPAVTNLFTDPELLWLTGYSAEVKDDKGNVVSDEFMCHNNLNITGTHNMPWDLLTQGTDIRLFTLTEGQTDVTLPEGFAIPVLSNQELSIISQVLNHNIDKPGLEVQHSITLRYHKDSEARKSFTPLYQQSIFITRQTAGPAGEYGEAPGERNITSLTDSLASKSKVCCNNEILASASFNPFVDEFGREYTGHWVLPKGVETLRTNVTEMLNLAYDTKIHYISVHVHPFCQSLDLRDITESKTLYKAYTKNHKDKIGLEHIDAFSSQEGIPVFKDHEYELISVYNNPTDHPHTAMATMFLYMEEK